MKEASEYSQNVTSASFGADDTLEKLRASILPSAAAKSDTNAQPMGRVKVKLPKIELWKFNGKVAEWREFRDAFSSDVHKNPELAKVDKLKYLKRITRGIGPFRFDRNPNNRLLVRNSS